MGMGSRAEYESEYCSKEFNSGYCKRKGYEYKYRFVAVIPKQISDGYEPSLEKKVFSFKINTGFFLLKTASHDDDEEERMRFMGSEIYRTCMYDSDGETYLKERLRHKLAAYWMPDDAIGSFVSGAFEFAKQYSVYFDDRLIISVAVDLEVCTVQLQNESLDHAFRRASRLSEGFHLLDKTD